MILDADIINEITYHEHGVSIHMGLLLEDLVEDVKHHIKKIKKLLPAKVVREHVPHVLWIAVPTHKYFGEEANELRRKFNDCLLTLISNPKAKCQNMSVLKMLKVWNHNDPNIFMERNYRYTKEGLIRYWMSVDAAIRFWDVALSKKFEKLAKTKISKAPKTATSSTTLKKPKI